MCVYKREEERERGREYMNAVNVCERVYISLLFLDGIGNDVYSYIKRTDKHAHVVASIHPDFTGAQTIK